MSEPLLEGSIPAELGYLSRLKSLILNNDSLEGTVSNYCHIISDVSIDFIYMIIFIDPDRIRVVNIVGNFAPIESKFEWEDSIGIFRAY